MSSHHYTSSVNVTSALANLVITHATSMLPGVQKFEETNLACNQRKAMETASVPELLAAKQSNVIVDRHSIPFQTRPYAHAAATEGIKKCSRYCEINNMK